MVLLLATGGAPTWLSCWCCRSMEDGPIWPPEEEGGGGGLTMRMDVDSRLLSISWLYKMKTTRETEEHRKQSLTEVRFIPCLLHSFKTRQVISPKLYQIIDYHDPHVISMIPNVNLNNYLLCQSPLISPMLPVRVRMSNTKPFSQCTSELTNRCTTGTRALISCMLVQLEGIQEGLMATVISCSCTFPVIECQNCGLWEKYLEECCLSLYMFPIKPIRRTQHSADSHYKRKRMGKRNNHLKSSCCGFEQQQQMQTQNADTHCIWFHNRHQGATCSVLSLFEYS